MIRTEEPCAKKYKQVALVIAEILAEEAVTMPGVGKMITRTKSITRLIVYAICSIVFVLSIVSYSWAGWSPKEVIHKVRKVVHEAGEMWEHSTKYAAKRVKKSADAIGKVVVHLSKESGHEIEKGWEWFWKTDASTIDTNVDNYFDVVISKHYPDATFDFNIPSATEITGCYITIRRWHKPKIATITFFQPYPKHDPFTWTHPYMWEIEDLDYNLSIYRFPHHNGGFIDTKDINGEWKLDIPGKFSTVELRLVGTKQASSSKIHSIKAASKNMSMQRGTFGLVTVVLPIKDNSARVTRDTETIKDCNLNGALIMGVALRLRGLQEKTPPQIINISIGQPNQLVWGGKIHQPAIKVANGKKYTTLELWNVERAIQPSSFKIRPQSIIGDWSATADGVRFEQSELVLTLLVNRTPQQEFEATMYDTINKLQEVKLAEKMNEINVGDAEKKKSQLIYEGLSEMATVMRNNQSDDWVKKQLKDGVSTLSATRGKLIAIAASDPNIKFKLSHIKGLKQAIDKNKKEVSISDVLED